MVLGRFGCLLLLAPLACGPAVGVGDEVGTTGAETTTGTDSTPTSVGPVTRGDSGGVATTSPATSSDPTSATVASTQGPTATTSSGDAGDESSDGGGTFIVDPDSGTIGVCDIWQQDCQRGYACRPWASSGDVWDWPRCSPVVRDPDEVGEPCVVEDSPVSGVDSCGVGAMCVNVDEATLEGTCVEFCGGTPSVPSCPQVEDTCVVGNDELVPLCLRTCDPLLQDCGEGLGCVGSWGEGDFFCARPGLPLVDDAGVMPAACVAGRVAVPPELIDDCDESSPCCADFCDLANPDPGCVDGFVCQPFVPEGSTPGAFFVGACVSP